MFQAVWHRSLPQKYALQHAVANARTYQEWKQAAEQLDTLEGSFRMYVTNRNRQ